MQLIQENSKLFKRGESCTNNLFFQKIKVDIKYPNMWAPLVLIMTLSYGQIEVERGFNNNRLVLKCNLKVDSIVARHFINSYMIQKEIQPHEMPITPQLMKFVIAACDRYRLHLEEQKKDKVQTEIASRKQEMINELQSVKENCQGMQDLIRGLDIKFVNLAKKAEEKNDIKF